MSQAEQLPQKYVPWQHWVISTRPHGGASADESLVVVDVVDDAALPAAAPAASDATSAPRAAPLSHTTPFTLDGALQYPSPATKLVALRAPHVKLAPPGSAPPLSNVPLT